MILVMAVASSNPVSAQDVPELDAEPFVESPNGVYLVQMLEEPVVAYTGGIAGYKATAPEDGAKIDPLSKKVATYATFLVGKHDKALKKAGGGEKLYDYVYSYNGFAARLNEQQAKKLASLKNVKLVTRMNCKSWIPPPHLPSSVSMPPAACGSSLAELPMPAKGSSSAWWIPVSGRKASASLTVSTR